ncbi:MAG: AAA family ATPase [Phycisphaerales bacterium]|nr:AAA family ATPase [Phycisphaerales bacterium]
MRTIAIVNQKGGCGKTTTAINLAAVLAKQGVRTLLVDMDPQSHCAAGLGVPESRIETGIAEAMLSDLDHGFDPAPMLWEVMHGLDLLPSTMMLAGLEAPDGGLYALPDRDRRLARVLQECSVRYDICLIDCSPSIGLLTYNALRASTQALIPVETGYFSLRGARRQWGTIQSLIERIARPIQCNMLPTLFNPDSRLAARILEALHQHFPDHLLSMVVREHEPLREAASLGQPITEFAPGSEAEQDYLALARWVIEHPPQVQPELLDRRSAASVPPPQVQPSTRVGELALRMQAGFDATPAAAREPVGTAPTDDVQESEPPASSIEAKSQELDFGVIITDQGICFRQPGLPEQSMSISADFNGWSTSATPMRFDRTLGCFQAIVPLPPGRYRYQVVIDGRSRIDPYNESTITGETGASTNSFTLNAAP